MRQVLSGRILFFALVLLVVIWAYLSLNDRTQYAQERVSEPAAAKVEYSSDAVTDDIRSRSKEIVVIDYNRISDRETAAKHGRIVAEYGSFAVLVKDKKTSLKRSGLETRTVETTINLPGAKFDPIGVPPAGTVNPGVSASKTGAGYYIVQFGSIAKDEWLDDLRDAGVEILQYVPHQAFFVYGEGDAIAKVAGHSRVRWIGEYRSEQKLSRELDTFVANIKTPVTMFDVAVFKRADLRKVSSEIAQLISGQVVEEIDLANSFFDIVRIETPPGDVRRIATIPDLIRIDQYEKPLIEDERAAQIVAGNFTSTTVLSPAGYNPLTQFGVDGTGVTVAVSDDGISIPGNGGFYITLGNTIDGPLRGATAGASGGHGHINASIIAGAAPFSGLDPTGYNYGIGVAPKANIINIPFLKSGNTTTDQQSFDDTLNTLGPNGVGGTISNNSWGNGTNSNSYDSYAAMYDGFVRDASFASTFDPITIIFSAGNSGPGALSLTRPKVAKNIIAVANSENIRTEILAAGADNLDDLRNSSSRGPAADGRVKPDITAPGTAITGSRAGTGGSVSGQVDANVSYSSGTSHAAPQVAGAAALFTQYWKNTHTGINPSPAMIKSAILNTGQEMNGLVTNSSTVPNGNEGWGRMNMKYMLNTGVPMAYLDQEYTFTAPGQGMGIIGTVADPSKPVRVSLVWTDPPGVGNPALVNNLDLQVNIDGNFYRGNVFSSGQSTTGGTADTLNNVEHVWLPAGVPAGSFFSIVVSAAAINGDGVLGNADTTDQHFAIVAYNFTGLQAPPEPPYDFDGDRKTDIGIFRPGPGEWWYSRSSDNQVFATQFGAGTDKIVPGDFTGDGKADVAVWRPADGFWYVLRSEDYSFFAFPFGTNGDVPVPADYDADGMADAAVFRPSTNIWYILQSGGGTAISQFGSAGDQPVVADYDGDGKADIGIFRPSAGQWWIERSTAGLMAFQFGEGTDEPVQGDYTGDGKADAAFFRPSSGSWFILRSEDNSYYSVPFGTNGDVPAPGDYDGDGKFDTTVFRPSQATWYIQRSTAGTLITQFGSNGDQPIPNAFVP